MVVGHPTFTCPAQITPVFALPQPQGGQARYPPQPEDGRSGRRNPRRDPDQRKP